jgi:hypothetical protein
MDDRSLDASRRPKRVEETFTPFLERSILELNRLFAQLFTTPFAVLTYNKQFQDQIAALAEDDLETVYPLTIARPLSFFVLMMSGHFLLSGFYNSLTPAALETAANNVVDSFHDLVGRIGETPAVALVAFAITLIVAVKAQLVTVAGHMLGCRIRFKTALDASAYAFGTFIFFHYTLLLPRYFLTMVPWKGATSSGLVLVLYGSLALSMLLVVRVNQIIRRVDDTPNLKTYAAWFVGTVIWQFIVALGAIYTLQENFSNFWGQYAAFWTEFGAAFLLRP